MATQYQHDAVLIRSDATTRGIVTPLLFDNPDDEERQMRATAEKLRLETKELKRK